jgi:hypothetical protein
MNRYYSSKLRIEPDTTGWDIDTSGYTEIYNYSGKGLLYGFQMEVNNKKYIIKFTVDGEVIFDLNAEEVGYLFAFTENNPPQSGSFIRFENNYKYFDFSVKTGIRYNSNVKIEVKSTDKNREVYHLITFIEKAE